MAELIGTGGNDTLLGGSQEDTLTGLGGDDILDGGSDKDSVDGGEGNDSASGGSSHDTVIGGPGEDTVIGGSGSDVLYGDEDNDTISGGSGSDDINTGTGTHDVNGGSGSDDIVADAGNDTINSGSGSDNVEASDGDNYVRGGSGSDDIITGNGNDTVDARSGSDYVSTNEGDDIIDGGTGNDSLFGGAGNDFIEGGSGSDWIVGGPDNGAGDTGGSEISVEFLSSVTAGFSNSFGYYVKDGSGDPTVGKIIWANVKDVVDPDLIIVPGSDPDDIGFFMIPNGANKNPGLADGDDVDFAFEGGRWVAKVGGTPLEGTLVNGSSDTEPVAYFSDPTLNPDGGFDHVTDNAEAGNQNWEDLFGGGDNDFNDVNLRVEVTEVPGNGGDGGDTLTGESGSDTFVYTIGTDGVDVITDFGRGGDKLRLIGSSTDVAFAQVGDDVVVNVLVGDNGSITLLGTDLSDVMSDTMFV